MTEKKEYGSASILPDATIIAKILITASKLFNAYRSKAPSHEIADALNTLNFYTDELMRRHSIKPAPEDRHIEYNSHFVVAKVLRPLDYAALILQKALRLHAVFHATYTIHHDSAADLHAYLHLIRRKEPRQTPTQTPSPSTGQPQIATKRPHLGRGQPLYTPVCCKLQS